MKHLSTIIREALEDKKQKLVDVVSKSMGALIVNNKVRQIQVDINNLNKPEVDFDRNDLLDKSVQSIIKNKFTGMTYTSFILSNQNDMLTNTDNSEMTLKWRPYLYKEGNNVYMIGLYVYTEDFHYVDEMIHLVSLDTSVIVENDKELLTAMFNDQIDYIKKTYGSKYVGITIKSQNNAFVNSMKSLGFKQVEGNNNIYSYELR